MRSWTTMGKGAALALAGLAAGVPAARAQDPGAAYGEPAYEELSARVWFDRGDDPMVNRGDRVRIYYRTNQDAYVAIFNIDTNGTVRLVFPRSPDEGHYVRGGRDYRLLFPGSPYWYVDDHPGIGYYFIVASPEPFDFSTIDYSYYDRGWDLTRVGRTVYSDPYVAMDDYVAALIPDWEYVAYALDFSTYNVGSTRYDYPRFLCYDCHAFRPYTAWNPYLYTCSQFRIVVYTDPWYYPSFRYRGSRVVYSRPPRPWTPRFEFKERALGDPVGVQYVARPPVADRPGVAGDRVIRRSTAGVGSGGVPSGSGVAGSPGASRPGVPADVGRPTRSSPGSSAVRGRPSDQLPGRGSARSGTVSRPPASILPRTGEPDGARRVVPPTGTEGRPVLERRSPPGGAAPPTTRSGTRGSAPPVTRGGTGTTSGSTPPVRSGRPAGSGNTQPTRVVPSTGSRASPPARSAPPASGSSGRSGSSPPVRRTGRGGGGEDPVGSPTANRSTVLPPERTWVPVLGGSTPSTTRGSGAESPPERSVPRTGSGGSPSARATPSSGIEITRGGSRGGALSPGSTVTRTGGIEIIRGAPSTRAAPDPRVGGAAARGSSRPVPSRPSAVLGTSRTGVGGSGARSTPTRTGTTGAARTAPVTRGATPSRGTIPRASTAPSRPTTRSLPTRPGGSSGSSARPGSVPSRPPASVRPGSSGRTSTPARPPARASSSGRSGGAARAPARSTGGGASRVQARPPVRRTGGGRGG